MALERTHSWPAGHWDWPIHLSHKHGLCCAGLIFVGGQVDLDSQGVVLNPGDLRHQIRAVMANIGAVLAEFGANLDDVTMLSAFYVSDGTVDEAAFLADVGAALPPGARPAVTAVPLPALAYDDMMVEIAAIAMRRADGRRMTREPVSLTGLYELPAPFVHAVRCGEMIFVSGQAAVSPGGDALHAGDVVRQSRTMMDNIGAILDYFGAGLDDTVKFTNYYVGEGNEAGWAEAARIRAGYFNEPGPAATGVPVATFHPAGTRVKMDVIAMLGVDGKRLPRSHVWPEGHWDWPVHLPYKHGLKCGNMIFLGGQVSLDSQANVIDPGDMVAQTRTSMANIAAVLAGFGATLDDVVNVRTFYAGGASAEVLHSNLAIRSAAFTEPGPTSTGIPLPYLAFEDMVVEIEVIAMVES